MIKSKGFGLGSVIIIMIITAIVAGLTMGIIMLNNDDANINSYHEDKDLQEFIDTYEVLLSKYYDDIDKKAMLEAAENGMMDFLGDKYTTYLQDSEYQEIVDELSKTYMGIGIEVSNNVIKSITADSPAFKSGLLEGDIITKINGINTKGMKTEEVNRLIKNDQSDYINLEIQRGNLTLPFNIKKAKLPNISVNYKIIDNTSIGYLYIKNFSENLDEQVSAALKYLESNGITSLIIDLRGNAGGYLQSAEKTSSLFLEEGKIIYSLKNSNSEKTTRDETKEKRTYPLIVLIDYNTASSAEIMASALKESYGATLVGSKTYGKGKVQEVVKLGNGNKIKTTSAKWYTPLGICIDGIGLNPDYNELYLSSGPYNDTQLLKAVNLLSNN